MPLSIICECCEENSDVHEFQSSFGDVPFVVCRSCRTLIEQKKLSDDKWFRLAAVHGADAWHLRGAPYSYEKMFESANAEFDNSKLIPSYAEMMSNPIVLRDAWLIALTDGCLSITDRIEQDFPAAFSEKWYDIVSERLLSRASVSIKTQCAYVLRWSSLMPRNMMELLCAVDETALGILIETMQIVLTSEVAARAVLDAVKDGLGMSPCLLTSWRGLIASMPLSHAKSLQQEFDLYR